MLAVVAPLKGFDMLSIVSSAGKADASVTPRDIPSLLAAASRKFHCVAGPPRAYFEFPTAPHPDAPRVRAVYQIMGYAARGWRVDVEAELVGRVWDDLCLFQQFYANTHGHEAVEDGMLPLLFWRRPPEITEVPPRAAGHPVGWDSEGREVAVPTGWDPGQFTPISTISYRLWIPGVQLRYKPQNDTHKDFYGELVYV